MKRVSWLDSVRVFSSLLVIISHYVVCFKDFDNFPIMNFCFLYSGYLGVILFFAISGYLVNKSLERSSGLLNFYKWRVGRICIPFATSYFVLGSALMILAVIAPSLAEYSPFADALDHDGFPKIILLGMIPHDINLTTLLGFGTGGVFVGEWFIGTIIWLYLLAPFLNKAVRRAPLVTFAASILISIGTFYAAEEFVKAGILIQSWWLFSARLPEFLAGMILAVYKDFFELHRRKILIAAASWTLIIGSISVALNTEIPALMLRLYPSSPRSLLLSLTTIYLFFALMEYLNQKFPPALAKINSFAGISYISMLIQHIIIYVVTDRLELASLQTFGLIYIWLLITALIVYASRFIKNFSDALENYFLKRN
ncbi:MAG: acyltransferase [Selenomonadaceae bacterium]|nr:acyltransferase [Selenomonadaceae bacterium]